MKLTSGPHWEYGGPWVANSWFRKAVVPQSIIRDESW